MQFFQVFLIFCSLSAVLCYSKYKKEDLEDLRVKIAKAHDKLKTNKFSPRLEKIIEKIPYSPDTRGDSVLDFYACDACMTSIDEFMTIRRVELVNETFLINLAIELCTAFEIRRPEVCRGFVEFYAPPIIYIVDNRPELSAETVCRLLLNDGDCLNPSEDDSLNFSVAIEQQSSQNDKQTSKDDIVIVHLTDIHVDLMYKKGALAECEDDACCRDINDETTNESHLAGYWGDYRSCDTPLNAIEDAFHHIVKQHPKIDAIYFTGDIVDHFMWATTIDGIKDSLSKIYGLMKSVFKDIPLYPILGNHEAQNLFSPLYINTPSLSTDWLYNHMADLWDDKFSNESIDTIEDGGYYTELVKPGLRVIALNNNPCYIYNFWVLYDVEPMREQYQWLHDTLLKAEQAGEKVHILSHIPNGVKTFHEPCSREYQRIVERFKDTIVAEFNGHLEAYGFHLYYEAANISNPVAVSFNGGSLASFSNTNRNYVVYDVCPKTFEVKEAQVWTYDLIEANQKQEHEKPQWFKQPSLRESFNLPDLKPATLNAFVLDMTKNSSIFQQFWKLQIRGTDKKCNDECFRDSICEIVVSDNTNSTLCDNLWK